jgi:hypothetical protein
MAPSHFLKIPPNIILPSTSGSPQWSLYEVYLLLFIYYPINTTIY